MKRSLSQSLLLKVCLVICLLNFLLVIGLAGAGVLKTARQGDITYVDTVNTSDGRLTLPPEADRSYVIENPTDADFFYNIIIHVNNGGSLYPGNSHNPFVQLAYKYSPVVFYFFKPLTWFGYLGFKIILLLLSACSVTTGTYLLIAAEAGVPQLDEPQIPLLISFASLGFQPMVANFKTAQTTPIIYLFLCTMWWFYRHDRDIFSGATLVGATLFKPYFGGPLILHSKRTRIQGILGFMIVFIIANVSGLIAFGFETVLNYYQILFSFLLAEGSRPQYNSFANWSPSHFRPLYWLGPWTLLARLVLLIPVGISAIMYALDYIDRSLELLCLSLLSILITLQTATAIDLGIVLMVFVLLGYQTYRNDQRQFTLIVLSFLFVEIHAYVLEILVGWGAIHLTTIQTYSTTILQLMPMLQPAVYGVGLSYILVSWRIFTEVQGELS